MADLPLFSRKAGGNNILSKLSRRELIRAGGVGAAASALWLSLPRTIGATSVPEALEELLASRAAIESTRIGIDLPPAFEHGNTVPLAVTVDVPAAGGNHVRRVSIFAEGNPFPEVASFHFTPRGCTPRAFTRIRLNEGRREVVAVAELADGSAWLARRTIEISKSGCGIEAGAESGDVMPRPEPRLTMPAAVRPDEIVEIKTMISHRMETGLRFDGAGKPIPRRIINRMLCSRDDEPIFVAYLSPAIAANAYLNFYIVAREAAILTFTWHEDGGAVYRASRSLTVI